MHKEKSDINKSEEDGVLTKKNMLTINDLKRNIEIPTICETAATLVLGLRVPASIYRIYNEVLTNKQRKLVREFTRQFFVYIVSNISSIKLQKQQNVINFNVNINLSEIKLPQEEGDIILRERIKQLEKKLKEAREVLQEYKEKAKKFDTVCIYFTMLRKKQIDMQNFIISLERLCAD
ncbi:MAG: hypothetical protein QW789_03500 [Nitrososphaerota archaeon]